MKMFSGKKRYLKVVSLLLVCCMIAGIIGVQPMVAEAAVTTDMFRKEAGGTANDANITMTDQTDGSVFVQHSADADSNLSNHTISTTNNYMYQLADGVHLEISDIKGRTGYENQYSFVLFMGLSWNHYYFQNLNYADAGIAMAFGYDGSYKIWTTASANNPNPSKDADYVLAYGNINTENAPCNNGDDITLDIQRESIGNYYVVVNGEKIEFQSDYSEADVHLAFHVWAPLHSENYQFCYDNDASKGTFSTGYGPQGSSYVITDIQKVDLDATEGKGFLDDYNNYKTYEIEERYDSYPLTFEAEVYIPEGLTDEGTYGMIAGTNTIGGGKGFDIRVLSDGHLMIYLRNGYSTTADLILYNAKITPGEWTHVAVVVEPTPDATTGQYYALGYINGVQKAKVGFGFGKKLNDTETEWIAGTPVNPTTFAPRNNMIIGANNIPADPNPAEGDTVANTSVYKNSSGANLNSCFQGRIKSVGFWGDVRTAEEISNDYSAGVTVDDENLWGYYEPEEGQDIFDDLSSNQNDAVVHQSWMTKSELGEQALVKDEDYAYSMVVVGDTQIINQTSNNSIDPNADGDYEDSTMTQIYRWIAENKDALNIEFVLGVGDITDDNETEAYANANYAYANYLLANDIRFASVLGDHDRSTGFNSMEYLKDEGYTTYIVENYWKDVKNIEGRMDDTCQVLQVGSLKYLIISLGCGPSPDVLKWASDMCKKYSDHNVIIHTHAYLQYDGTTIDPVNDASIAYTQMESATNEFVTIYTDARTDGEDLWKTVVEPNENVTLVLSGHVTPLKGVTYSTQTRDDESVVAQLLTNPQDIDGAGLDSSSNIENARPTGMVSILYYDEDGNIVAHRNYSTIQQKYYCDVNQFDNLGNNVIVPGAVKDVELSEGNLLLLPGQTETLTATLTPSTASDTVTWSSSDDAVATVDATTGVVTAVAKGETLITATAGSCKAECKIWVTEKPSENLQLSKVNIGSGTNISIADDIYGVRMTYASGIYDWERSYITQRYIKDGYNLNIDNIETESEDYTVAIMIHYKSDNAWYDKNGYMLLLRKSGEVAIVGTNVNGWLDSTAIDSAVLSELNDSISLRFHMEDTTCVVEVNGTELEIPNATEVLGTSGYVRFSLGAAKNFTLSEDSSLDTTITTLNYGSTILSAPLSYRINYIGYDTSTVSVLDSYSDIFDYYRASGEIPVKGGYVFAGWYEDAEATTPVAVSDKEAEDGKTYYAKFLPKDVLTVKAQLKLAEDVSTTDTSGKTEMRLITTVDDTLNFAEVGFVVTSGTTSKTYPRYTAYSSLSAAGVEMTPSVFNACSKRFATVNIGNVTWNETTKPVDRPITVQAYWKTCDGTIVYGTARTLTIQQGLDAIDAATQPYSL